MKFVVSTVGVFALRKIESRCDRKDTVSNGHFEKEVKKGGGNGNELGGTCVRIVH